MGSIPSVVILSQDSFYKRLDEEALKRAFASMHDFDHPDAIDMPLFASVCRALPSQHNRPNELTLLANSVYASSKRGSRLMSLFIPSKNTSVYLRQNTYMEPLSSLVPIILISDTSGPDH
jgi:hypothetical protein